MKQSDCYTFEIYLAVQMMSIEHWISQLMQNDYLPSLGAFSSVRELQYFSSSYRKDK